MLLRLMIGPSSISGIRAAFTAAAVGVDRGGLGSVAWMQPLAEVGPAFIEMAHRIVWCTVATTGADGRPRTRVLHPIWEWDGSSLTGWIATSPLSPKAGDLAAVPAVSLTYWAPDHDTCTAKCDAEFCAGAAERRSGWQRFANGPAPVGYDPAIVPGWTSPDADAFGILRLTPHRLRVMDGSLMTRGEGRLLRWRG
jgi:Pyridoxamine 5'-phosphate oxidase